MGIYSTEAAELYKNSQVEFNPNAAGLLEFAVETQRSDLAMFETMLEMDFLEYTCESGLCVITEEEQSAGIGNALKSIGKKIVEALEKIMQTIQLAIQKLTNFATGMIKTDKRLIEKYGKDIDLAKAKANNPDKEVAVVDFNAAAKEIASFISSKKSQYETAVAKNAIGDVSAKIESLKKDVEGVMSLEKYYTKKKIADISEAELDDFVAVVSGSYKVADIVVSKEATDFLGTLKKARAEARKLVVGSYFDKEATQDSRKDLSSKFKYISALNGVVAHVVNFGSNITTRTLAESRKAYVAIATAALKKEKKATNESASYDEMFEYAFEVATDNLYSEFTLA